LSKYIHYNGRVDKKIIEIIWACSTVFAHLALLKKVRKSEMNELFYFEKAPIIRALRAVFAHFFSKSA